MTVVFISCLTLVACIVINPDPGSGAFLTPGSRMGNNLINQDLDSGSASRMNPDNIYKSLETIVWVKILKFFDADKENPGWKKFGSGIKKKTDPG
jgi:hypothetical protein